MPGPGLSLILAWKPLALAIDIDLIQLNVSDSPTFRLVHIHQLYLINWYFYIAAASHGQRMPRSFPSFQAMGLHVSFNLLTSYGLHVHGLCNQHQLILC